MINNLKKFREKANYTQEKFAQKLDVTNDYISMIERGRRTPSMKLAKMIADELNKTVDEVFFDN